MYLTNYLLNRKIQLRHIPQFIIATLFVSIMVAFGSMTANAQKMAINPQQAECAVDVIFVLDVSGSMNGQPIAAAKAASIDFINQMDFSTDRVGLVSFNHSANFHNPPGLTTNGTTVQSEISGLSASGGTNIAAGITAATNAFLANPNPNPNALPVMILLTDGNSAAAPAVAAADTADLNGIRIIAIGLGGSVNTSLLQNQIATTPDDYYASPTTGDLQQIYDEILEELCEQCVAAPKGMVAWYPFDNKIFVNDGISLNVSGSPTAWDIHGLHNGTKVNGPTTAPGMVQHALQFNGVNQFVNVPHNNDFNFGTGDFSFDSWVRFPSGHSGIHPILQKHNSSGLLNGYHWFLKDGQMALQMTSGGTAQVYFSGVSLINDGQWHLLAVSVQRGTNGGRWYIDGNPVGTPFTPLSGSINNTAPLQLGKYTTIPTGEYHLNGILDEVEIFDRALGAAEVQSIYAAGEHGKCKDPCPYLAAASQDKSNDDNAASDAVSAARNLRDKVWSESAAGRHMTAVYEQYSGRVTSLLLRDPELRTQVAKVLWQLRPAISALTGEEKERFMVTEDLAAGVRNALNYLQKADVASEGGILAEAIERELSIINPEKLVGRSAEEAWSQVVQRYDESIKAQTEEFQRDNLEERDESIKAQAEEFQHDNLEERDER